jgi:signal transduction histidine kinase
MAEKCQELEREQMLEYIHKIGDSNQHLIDLVGDLLSVSRVESEKAREKRRVTNIKLKTLLIEAVEEVKMLTEEKKVTIEGVDAMSEKIMLKGDKTQLLQVFSNVVNNAVKFSHDGGVVGVSVKTKGKRVVVCVSDKGIGIPRRQLKKVSEKFFRADNASKISTGSGLGLYIVTRLLEIHGGSFRIESEENRGTKVYVELPIMYNGR